MKKIGENICFLLVTCLSSSVSLLQKHSPDLEPKYNEQGNLYQEKGYLFQGAGEGEKIFSFSSFSLLFSVSLLQKHSPDL